MITLEKTVVPVHLIHSDDLITLYGDRCREWREAFFKNHDEQAGRVAFARGTVLFNEWKRRASS